jgi:hypothetical protein
MHQIVTPHEPENMAHTLGPTLRVEADAIELLRAQLLPKLEICGSKAAKLIESEGKRDLAVTKFRGPPILIVALEQRTLLGQDHLYPEAGHQIAIGQVLNDFDNRPFARRLGPPENRLGHSAEPGRQPRHHLAQHVEGVTRPEEIEQRPDVCGSGGGGASGWIGESHHTSTQMTTIASP